MAFATPNEVITQVPSSVDAPRKPDIVGIATLEIVESNICINVANDNAIVTHHNVPPVNEAADATKEAWLALKRTDIKSPVTGYIAQRSVQVGETVSPGQSLMAVVPARQMWVNANFKETRN